LEFIGFSAPMHDAGAGTKKQFDIADTEALW
jgi:hypothetical protein